MHEAWLDAQLTRSIAALMDRRLVTLNVVAQDGLRVRAHAKASSFRRREKLAELLAQAQAQVQALKHELTEDAGASARRKQAAVERAARDREQRLAAAVAAMDKLQRKPPREPKKPKPSKRRGGRGPDDPGAGVGANDNNSSSSDLRPATPPEPEPRVSATDADARVMKMADGGFRPAFNAQLAVDVQTQLIAAVALTNSGSDMGQMSPMHLDIQQRYATTPEHWLADGGFTKLQAIDELTARGTQPVRPPPRSRNPGIDSLAPNDTDSPAQARWRAFMRSDAAKVLYIQRGATVECANAQLRRRGLHRFNVCGMAKARAVLLWHALAHNLMRMRSLNIAFAEYQPCPGHPVRPCAPTTAPPGHSGTAQHHCTRQHGASAAATPATALPGWMGVLFTACQSSRPSSWILWVMVLRPMPSLCTASMRRPRVMSECSSGSSATRRSGTGDWPRTRLRSSRSSRCRTFARRGGS